MAKQTFTTGQVLTAAQMTNLQQTAMLGGAANARTASYVLVAGDAGNCVSMSNAAATTITVNTGIFAAGDIVTIINIGSGTCTITAGTATVSKPTNASLALSSNAGGVLYFTAAAAAIFLPFDTGASIVPDMMAGKNGVINGALDFWQRGTSNAITTTAYVADRFVAYRAVAGSTVSRQVTNDTTNLPFIQYCARVQRDSGNSSTSIIYFGQPFETVNSIPYAGKTVTFSFYARAGANYSAASSALSVFLNTGTGTDQNVITGSYTGNAQPINQTATLTTTWQRFSYTATLAATITELTPFFGFTPVGTAGANDWFEITGLQLEVAPSATAFSRYSPTIQGELAACQRYYQRTSPASATRFVSGLLTATSTTNIQGSFPLLTSMRTTPTVVDYANVAVTPDNVSSALVVSSVTISGYSETGNILIMNMAVTGATQYRPYLAYVSSANSYLGFGAEL